MNIVLYVQSFLPSLGGRELVVHYLARSLQSLGHRVRVVIPGGFWCYRNIRLGYPVHRWPTLRGRAAKYVMLPQLLLDTTLWGCDVIHAHSTYSSGYIASLLKKVRNVPLVITPHGEDIHVIPEIGFGQRLDPIQRPKIEYALKNADVVTAISGSIKASLLDAGTAPEKIREIPNGVDLERFQKTSGIDVRRWLGLPPDARLLVTVGNYHPRKGHESLLRAMPYILKSEPRARLVIVGRNSGELLPLIQDLGLEKKVIMTGQLAFPLIQTRNANSEPQNKPDVLAAIYQNSEAYISSGLQEGAEGLSLAILEAMASGLPVIATDISGNRDMVKDNQVGTLVSPGHPKELAGAVVRLLSDRKTRTQMAENAVRLATEYAWSRIAKQYVATYKYAMTRSIQSKRYT